MYLVVGCGQMAKEYVKPLLDQGVNFEVVGRGNVSAHDFEKATGVGVIVGGIDAFLRQNTVGFDGAFVAVGVESLFSTTKSLLDHGVNNILVEKPAGLNLEQIGLLSGLAEEKGADVFVAYNRRLYGSVLKAEEIIEEDGGVTSFYFEITEWGHVIKNLDKAEGVKSSWFLANTTHVVDLAFYMGGLPCDMKSFVSTPCEWHPAGSCFSGAGCSVTGALFSYSGNWLAPGRWGVEILTSKSKLIFEPLEELRIQRIGTISQEAVEFDDELDRKYKPGLYRQVRAFIGKDHSRMCTLFEHFQHSKLYNEMAGYE